MPIFVQAICFILFWFLTCHLATKLSFRLFNDIKVDNKKITLFSRSFCPLCGHKLHLLEMIPLFSFLISKGKCRHCEKNISRSYLVIETILLLCYLLSVLLFRGINLQSFLFGSILLCLTIQSFIDLRVMMSSDVIHLITLLLSICLGKTFGIGNLQMLISFVFVVVFLLAIIVPFKLVKKQDGMGFGDVKLYAVLSVLFPLNYIVFLITISGVCGILFFYVRNIVANSKKNKEFPLIPSIFVSFLLTSVLYIVIICGKRCYEQEIWNISNYFIIDIMLYYII